MIVRFVVDSVGVVYRVNVALEYVGVPEVVPEGAVTVRGVAAVAVHD